MNLLIIKMIKKIKLDNQNFQTNNNKYSKK